jgi:type I restriction enzyme S subunit
MAGERSIRRLGEICEFRGGQGFPQKYQGAATGEYPFVKVSDMELPGNGYRITRANHWIDEATRKELRARPHPATSTIFAKIGIALTYNRRRLLSRPTIVDNNMMAAVPIESEVEPLFLYYLLKVKDFNEVVSGTALPFLNAGDLAKMEVEVPPLAEQKAIAAVLGALDEKIELNRRMNATLEAMARALFQSWFVDFDPVRAKMDGRKPAGMDDATAALLPEHFEHGEHDMLPVGWRIAAIEEVSAINAWTLGKNDDLETLEYVEISEVSRGNIGNTATYPRGEEPSRARRRLRHGDTVLSTVRPDRGSYFLALNPPENRVASTGFAVLTPTKVPWSFLHAALTQPEVSDHLGQMADGGAYPAVRPEVIGAMQVALPNEPKILEAFHRLCAPLSEQAEANRTQSRTLATLRNTLLPKLLSGELSVQHANTEKDVAL